MELEIGVKAIHLLDGIKTPDPWGRYRDAVTVLRAPEGEYVPMSWLDCGVLIAGKHFVPYGRFHAETEPVMVVDEGAEEAAQSLDELMESQGLEKGVEEAQKPATSRKR